MQQVNRGMREKHVPSPHFPLPNARYTYISAHTHKRRDTMDKLDDIFFYALIGLVGGFTVLVGIGAALHEAALRAGGV
jgi:hypothetical protein